MRISRFWSVTKTMFVTALVLIVCGAELMTRLPLARAGVPKPVVIGAAAPMIHATIYSADWCSPCRSYVAAVKKEMPPDGWRIREQAAKDVNEAHVVISKTYTTADKIELLPTTIIRRDGHEVERIVGEITPTALAEAINKQLKLP